MARPSFGDANLEHNGGHWLHIFPVYYRILLLFCIGLWCWALNLHGFRIVGIPATRLFRTRMIPILDPTQRGNGHGEHKPPTPLTPLYKLALVLTLVTLLSWWCYLLVPLDEPVLKRYVVLSTLVLLSGLLVAPVNVLAYGERKRFFRAWGRILAPTLTVPVLFSDVIFADILTSFSRVFADVYSAACDLSIVLLPDYDLQYPTHKDHLHYAFEGCKYDVFSPLAMCLPFFIRLRQCINEALNSPVGPARRRHFANALKYFSSLPVIGLSGYHQYLTWKVRDYDGDGDISADDHRLNLLSRLWLVAAMVNTMYCVYWDTAIDWNLGYTPHWYLQSLLNRSAPNLFYSPQRGCDATGVVALPRETNVAFPNSESAQTLSLQIPSDNDELVMTSESPSTGWSTQNVLTQTHPMRRETTLTGDFPSDTDSEMRGKRRPCSISTPLTQDTVTPGSPARVLKPEIPDIECLPTLSRCSTNTALLTPIEPQPTTTFYSHPGCTDAEASDEGNDCPTAHCSYFLRPQRVYDITVYYGVMIINVLLRTTWTLKISPHLPIETLPLGGFTLEALEIIRRWLWVYIRVEREWWDSKDRSTVPD
ncbi:protein-ER retention protein [Dispira simplex]|nr:protein-ER retention protein [Dispira simplex]